MIRNNRNNFDSELIERMNRMFNNEKKKEDCCCNENKCDCGTEIPITFVGIDKEEDKKCKCEEQKCCDTNCIYEAPKVFFDDSENKQIDVDEDGLKSMVSNIVNELFGDELAKGNIKKIDNENDLESFKEEMAKRKIKEVEDEIDLDLEEDDDLNVEFDEDDDLYLQEHLYFDLDCCRIDAKDLWCFSFSEDKAQFNFSINTSENTLKLYKMITSKDINLYNKEFMLMEVDTNKLCRVIDIFVVDGYEVNVDANYMKIKLRKKN